MCNTSDEGLHQRNHRASEEEEEEEEEEGRASGLSQPTLRVKAATGGRAADLHTSRWKSFRSLAVKLRSATKRDRKKTRVQNVLLYKTHGSESENCPQAPEGSRTRDVQEAGLMERPDPTRIQSRRAPGSNCS